MGENSEGTPAPAEKPKRLSIEELNARRKAKIAAGDEHAKGGRPKVRLTRQEQEEIQRQGLKLLYSDAYEVLRRQITIYLETGEGAQDAQKAALRVIDQVEGKATQRIEQETTVTAVEYRSAAWRPLPDIEAERARRVLEAATPTPLALGAGDEDEGSGEDAD